jgi:hypothetical protein
MSPRHQAQRGLGRLWLGGVLALALGACARWSSDTRDGDRAAEAEPRAQENSAFSPVVPVRPEVAVPVLDLIARRFATCQPRTAGCVCGAEGSSPPFEYCVATDRHVLLRVKKTSGGRCAAAQLLVFSPGEAIGSRPEHASLAGIDSAWALEDVNLQGRYHGHWYDLRNLGCID